MMSVKKLLGALVLSLSTTSAIAGAEWRMATPYPDANFHTKNIRLFAEDVAKRTGGDIKINVHSAGSLIKHQEIKNAVRSRQVELGEFIISNLANEGAIFALDSVPFIVGSFADAKRLYDASKPELEKKLARQNIKLLYSVSWPSQGIYTDRPIEKIEDFQGVKMRAYSPQTERLAQLLGAVPTQVEVPDLAQAFTTGRVNAMITSTSTGVNTAAWDYLTHFYDVAAFYPKNAVVINQRVFDKLSPDNQKALLEAAAEAEKRGWEMAEKDHETQKQILINHKIVVGEGSDALNAALKKIGTVMASEWEKQADDTDKQVLQKYLGK